MASLCRDDSTKTNGSRNKQLDKIYELRSQPEEIVFDLIITPQRVIGARKSRVIKHMSCAPNLKRLWLALIKMTSEKMNDLTVAVKGTKKITEKKNKKKKKKVKKYDDDEVLF